MIDDKDKILTKDNNAIAEIFDCLEKEGLEKSNKIAELERQLKDCQEKNKKSKITQEQWIIGEYKWMAVGSKMPAGWVKIELNKDLTLSEDDKKSKTANKETVNNDNNFVTEIFAELWQYQKENVII